MSGGPLVGVLALQGDVVEHIAMLQRAGATARRVRRPGELEGLDGIVIPGGESTTMHKLARTFDLYEPLREAIAAGLPAFGTCAGMIMLADHIDNPIVGQESIGGIDVVVRRNAFGRQVDSFEAEVDLEVDVDVDAVADVEVGASAGAGSFRVLFIRAPWVTKVGTDVEVVARIASGGSVGRIVAVRQANLLATSFHPEITGDRRMHDIFLRMVASHVTGSSKSERTEKRK